jgi:cytochrome b561
MGTADHGVFQSRRATRFGIMEAWWFYCRMDQRSGGCKDLEDREAPIFLIQVPRFGRLENGRDLMTDSMAVPAYTLAARVLHWFTATLVLLMLPLGLVIAHDWGGPLQDQLYDLHRSIGALIIPIVLARLVYRWLQPPLPLAADIPTIQQLAAHATHWALYALLIVQPFVGWIGTSAYRAPIIVFGLFELPPIWPEDRGFSDRVLHIHDLIALTIACLLAAHIGAALHHHFVRRDRVLMRMITG